MPVMELQDVLALPSFSLALVLFLLPKPVPAFGNGVFIHCLLKACNLFLDSSMGLQRGVALRLAGDFRLEPLSNPRTAKTRGTLEMDRVEFALR